MHRVPLHPEQPPRNLPRLSFTCLLLTAALGSLTTFQSVSLSKSWDQLEREAELVSIERSSELQLQCFDSPPRHMNILQVLVVFASLNDKNAGVGVLGKSASYNATRSAATRKQRQPGQFPRSPQYLCSVQVPRTYPQMTKS